MEGPERRTAAVRCVARWSRGRVIGVGVTVVLALGALVACVPPPRPAPPTPTTAAPTTAVPTTAVPTTSTTVAPADTCEAALDGFLEELDDGVPLPPTTTIQFDDIDALGNPGTTATTGSPSVVSVSMSTYDDAGDLIAPSADRPITLSLYGTNGTFSESSADVVSAPGAEPLVVQLTSDDEVTFDYDGGYVGDGITVQATSELGTTNPCTDTTSVAIGATTIPVSIPPEPAGTESISLPLECPDGTSGTTCQTEVVDTFALHVRASVGYGAGAPSGADPTPSTSTEPEPADIGSYTVDTGSLGVAVPIGELGPNAVGPGGPVDEYYDSSGYQYVGYEYLAPVTFESTTGDVSTIPIRVMAVVGSGCAPNADGCTPPDPATFHYLGVGFDRATSGSQRSMVSPTDNALLRLAPPVAGDYSPGYVIAASGIRLGLPASDLDTFSTVALASSTSVPGDWQTAPGSVAITRPGETPSAIPGTLLMDTGISEMFISAAPGTFPGGLAADDEVQISSGGTDPDAPLFYAFSNDALTSGLAPSRAELIHVDAPPAGSVFVNTGRHVLFGFEYLFDARRGQVGFSPLPVPLR